MAAHQVAIAKASFAAALLRPDPTSVNRDDISRFHDSLEEVAIKCSPANVQKCKTWLIQHVVPSQGRIIALAKYVAALSASYTSPVQKDGLPTAGSNASTHRRRLHLLYVLNDLQHHTKHHAKDASRHTSLTSNLQPHLVALFQSAAGFDTKGKPKHLKRLLELLNIWEDEGYQSHLFIGKLKQTIVDGSDTVENVDKVSTENTGQVKIEGKEIPFIMPATHGDAATPYYDLPAGNLMPHIVPNTSEPINPDLVKPLRFIAGPADDNLVNVVRDFLKDVDAMYGIGDKFEDESIVVDVDEMGQIMARDEASGEWITKEGYYGWSVAFCERMRKRKKEGLPPPTNDRGRSRSRSRSDSYEPRKRRKVSYSQSRSSSRGSRTPYSRSRSSSRGLRDRGQSSKRQRSQTRSRSDSRRRRHRSYTRSRSRKISRDRAGANKSDSYSPPPAVPATSTSISISAAAAPSHVINPTRLQLPPYLSQPPNNALITPIAQITDPFLTSNSAPPPRPEAYPATHYNHNFPLNAQGLPVPPPPPFHQGAWPPPPPSIPPGSTYVAGQYSHVQYPGFVPTPPPPPPSAQYMPFGGQLPPQQQNGQMYGVQHGQYGTQIPPAPPPPGMGQDFQQQGNWQGGGYQGQGRGGWQGRGGRGGKW